MALLVLAEAAVRLFHLSDSVAAPSEAARALATGMADGTLSGDIATTLAVYAQGLALAIVIGVAVGLAIGISRTIEDGTSVVVEFLRPIPAVALIPLAILWFGLGNTAVVFVVFIAEFFPLYFNTEAGARNINPILVDAARCFGAKRLTLLRRVILPASIPYIITGMRIALGGAWRMIVAGEMLASQSGIGSVLMESRYQFRATDLMMAMILISVVGYVTERLIVGTLERKTTEKWEVKVL